MDEKQKREMKERNLDRLAGNPGGFQFIDTFFPYTSGEIGPYYVESIVVEANGRDYHGALDDFEALIRDTLPEGYLEREDVVISGGESRDWDFSNPIADRLILPHAKIYKNGKIKGRVDIKGSQVVPVADLNNEGSSPRKLWVPAINKAGGTANYIFFYVDRMEQGVQVMEDLGLVSNAVAPLDSNAWDYLEKKGVVNDAIYQNLRARGTTKEERDAWAVAMLRSDRGLERLRELTEKDPAKVKKILDEGYPQLREELVHRLLEVYKCVVFNEEESAERGIEVNR